MLISDNIAKLIEQMLDDGNGYAELKRNDLAARLGCVPSQISYVITSRFTPERGYLIESRRGGGGFIRIVRVNMNRNEYLMHFFCAIGDAIEENEAAAYMTNLRDNGMITQREYAIIGAAISQNALDQVPTDKRNGVRADILRHFIMALMR